MEPKYCVKEGEMLNPANLKAMTLLNSLIPRASSSSPPPQTKSHLRWPRTRRTRR